MKREPLTPVTAPGPPTRIQRRRAAGWRKPEGAVIVTRGSRWGNPFVVGEDADDREHATALYREWLETNSPGVLNPDRAWNEPDAAARAEYRQEMDDRRDWILQHAHFLRGKDLCCWCPPPSEGEPDHCHAAVLLKLANSPAAVAVARAVLGNGDPT